MAINRSCDGLSCGSTIGRTELIIVPGTTQSQMTVFYWLLVGKSEESVTSVIVIANAIRPRLGAECNLEPDSSTRGYVPQRGER